MTAARTTPTSHASAARSRPSRSRTVLQIVGPPALLLVVLATWLGIRGYAILRELTAAKAETATVQQAVLSSHSDPAQARLELTRLARDTAAARASAHDPIWSSISDIPGLGNNFKAIRAVSDSSDLLARDSLPALVTGIQLLAPVRHPGAGGAMALAPLQQAATPLASATGSLDQALSTVQGAPHSFLFGSVAAASRELATRLQSLQHRLHAVTDTVQLAPGLLGASSPRTYFLGFVNPAEIRGGGGLLGGYAIIRATRGRITVSTLGTDADLPNLPATPPGLDADFTRRYAQYGAETDWDVSNLSAHFPYTAQDWAQMYEALTKTHIDGVLSLDPAALAVLLRGSPPITVAGGVRVSAANVVDFIQRGEYSLTVSDVQRKGLLATLGTAAVRQLSSHPAALGSDILSALGDAAVHGHLRFASTHPDEQAVLAQYALAGVVPDRTGPFLTAFLNNAGSGKLDVYAALKVQYAVLSCGPASRTVRITVHLGNHAPASGLPRYVTARSDGAPATVPGQNRSLLALMLTDGAQLSSATLNGHPITTTPSPGGSSQPYLQPSTERGHPVLSSFLDLTPGASATLSLTITEPPTTAAVQLLPQPMPIPQILTTTGGC